jgi:hypothetical protein
LNQGENKYREDERATNRDAPFFLLKAETILPGFSSSHQTRTTPTASDQQDQTRCEEGDNNSAFSVQKELAPSSPNDTIEHKRICAEQQYDADGNSKKGMIAMTIGSSLPGLNGVPRATAQVLLAVVLQIYRDFLVIYTRQGSRRSRERERETFRLLVESSQYTLDILLIV